MNFFFLIGIYNIDLVGFDVDMFLSIGFVESFKLDFLIDLGLIGSNCLQNFNILFFFWSDLVAAYGKFEINLCS